MALLNLCMKFKIFLAKSILLKHYENGNKNFFWNMYQGPPNPGFLQEKVQKGDFLEKDSLELKFFFVLGSYESLKGLEC